MGRPLFSGKTLAAIASSEAQPVSLGLALAAAQLEQDQLAAPAVTKHLFEPQVSSIVDSVANTRADSSLYAALAADSDQPFD